MGDENVSAGSLSDSALCPQGRKQKCSVNESENMTLSETVFISPKRFHFDPSRVDDLTFSVPTPSSDQESIILQPKKRFQFDAARVNDLNFSVPTSSDQDSFILQPKTRFQFNLARDNDLTFSMRTPCSDEESVVLRPKKPLNLLKERNCDLTFNMNQSKDTSCSFQKKSRNITSNDRISNKTHPNFDVTQSSVDSSSKSAQRPPFRFNAPPDLTFGGLSWSEATSQESSCVSSDNRSSSTHTNSHLQSSSLSSTDESSRLMSKIESSSNFCADESELQDTNVEKSDEEELSEADITITGPSSTDGSNSSTKVSNQSKIQEDDTRSEGNSECTAHSVSAQNKLDEEDLSSISRLSRFRNTGNTFTKNDSADVSDIPISSPARSEPVDENKALGTVFRHEISSIAEANNCNVTYTIPVADTASTVAEETVSGQVEESSLTKEESTCDRAFENDEYETKSENNTEHSITIEASLEIDTELDSNLHTVSGITHNTSHVPGDDICESQESVVLVPPESRQKHLDVLKPRDPSIAFNLDDVSQNTTSRVCDENVALSQESVVLLKSEERQKPLNMLRCPTRPINFNLDSIALKSGGDDESIVVTQESVVLCKTQERPHNLDLLKPRECHIDFNIDFGQNTTANSRNATISKASVTNANLSALVQEESLTVHSRQSVGSACVTFEILQPDQLESEEVGGSESRLGDVTDINNCQSLQSISCVSRDKITSELIRSESEMLERRELNDTFQSVENDGETSESDEEVIDLLNPEKRASKNKSQIPNESEDEKNIDDEHPEIDISANVSWRENEGDVESEVESRFQAAKLEIESVLDAVQPQSNDTSTIANTTDHLSRLIQSESNMELVFTSPKAEMQNDSRCTVNTDNVSNYIQSETEPDSAFRKTKKFDSTYTIVNQTVDNTHVTGKYESLVNVSAYEESQDDTSAMDAETTVVSTTKNDTSAQSDVEQNENSTLTNNSSNRSIPAKNVTINEIGKSIEIQSDTLPPKAAVTSPLVGHSYCKLTRETVRESLEKETISEDLSVDVSAHKKTNSSVPRRKSSRLAEKKSEDEKRISTNKVDSIKETEKASENRESSDGAKIYAENDFSNQSETSMRKRQKTTLSKKKSSRSPREEHAERNASLIQLETSTHALENVPMRNDSVFDELESGVHIMDEDKEMEPLQDTPVNPMRRVSKRKSSRNTTQRSSQTLRLAAEPSPTPIAPIRKSGRLSKRKASELEADPNDVPIAPEHDSVKDVDVRRKSARLSTKAGYSVRFVDTYHSISTIEGTGRPHYSVSEDTQQPQSFNPSLTKSSSCSERSLVNKLFPENDENVFVQPTSAAPKTKKKKKADRSDQLLTFLEDKEIKELPKKPEFPRLADYIHKGLYAFLIEKMKPKYGITTNAKVVTLAHHLKAHVDKVTQSDEEYPEEEVKKFERVLARCGIVETHWDFWLFCRTRLLYDYRKKAFPIFVFKDGKRVVRNTKGIFDKILPDE